LVTIDIYSRTFFPQSHHTWFFSHSHYKHFYIKHYF